MNDTPKPQITIFWILWASFQIGIFMMYTYLHVPANSPRMHPAESLPWSIGLVPFSLSVLIRWVVLPRAKAAQQALVFMILGIAFAEAAVFFGIFLFPSHQQGLFLLGALGIFQFIPFFASRFLDTGPPGV